MANGLEAYFAAVLSVLPWVSAGIAGSALWALVLKKRDRRREYAAAVARRIAVRGHAAGLTSRKADAA